MRGEGEVGNRSSTYLAFFCFISFKKWTACVGLVLASPSKNFVSTPSVSVYPSDVRVFSMSQVD